MAKTCKQVRFTTGNGERVNFKSCSGGKGRRGTTPRRYISVYTGRPQQGAKGDDGRTKRVWGVMQGGSSVMATDADSRRALTVFRQGDKKTPAAQIPVWDGDGGSWTTWGKVSKAVGGNRCACAPQGSRATIRDHLFSDYEGAKRYLGSRARRKLPGNETVLRRTVDGDFAVYHHGTAILTYHKNGSLTFRPYNSLTTRQRLNHYFPSGIGIFREDWKQYVTTSRNGRTRTFAVTGNGDQKITVKGNVYYRGKPVRPEK